MIRSLQLTDIAALLLFLGRSPIEEARTRDRLNSKGIELLSAAALIKDCLMAGNKQHSLVYAQSGLIQGLVCLRRCSGPGAWAIEHLLLNPGREGVCLELLERLGFAGEKMGAERLFLRLDANSPAVDMAKQTGFNHYLTEQLYRLDDVRQHDKPEPKLALRAKSGADEHNLFRLYSSATPLQVRSVEGMTLQEWSQSRDRDAHRELVWGSGGEISAWLRVRQNRMAGQFEILSDQGAEELGRLVSYSLNYLRGSRPVYCLVPEFQQRLRQILEERGFRQAAAYSCFCKQLAVRVHEPRLMPLRA